MRTEDEVDDALNRAIELDYQQKAGTRERLVATSLIVAMGWVLGMPVRDLTLGFGHKDKGDRDAYRG